MSQLSISCLVYGSPDIFMIQIKPTARLSELQELIWEKKKLSFPGLQWDHLALWKVPFGDDDSVDNIRLADGVQGIIKLIATIHKRVGGAIPLEDVDTHLIVIQPPPKLWCCVRSLPKDTAFELQPFPDHKVSDLKNAIKEKMKPLFDDIPASTLVLWKVDMDKTQDHEDGLARGRKLVYDEVVQSIFPEPVPRDRISIIIDAESLFQNDASPGPHGMIDRVKIRRDIALERKGVYKGPPSTLAIPAEFQKIQESDKLYFGCARPLNREPPLPLALLHPVFGTFADDCKEITLSAHDYEFARRLRQNMCNFYVDEDARRHQLCMVLNEFGFEVTPGNIGPLKESTDGHIVEGIHPLYIQELKNELTGGHTEPSFQALLYYQSFVDQFGLDKNSSSCHPCFIIYLLGPHVAFAGAALTDRANLEVFSLVSLNIHTTNDEAFESLARHWVALKRALQSLQDYYRELDSQTLQPANDTGPYFPHPTSFNNMRGDAVSSLTYKGNLGGRDLVFKGLIDEGNKLVCIKFVRRYGTDVHRWCAGKGIAPDLLGFEKLPGGWYLVVMELLEKPWELLWELKRYMTFSPSEELNDQLRSVLVEMHQNHMVHGDIRDTNVMVDTTNNASFKLLDFDWAGKVEEVKYPKFVNTQPELRRPKGVADGKVILPAHDVAMVERVFETA